MKTFLALVLVAALAALSGCKRDRNCPAFVPQTPAGEVHKVADSGSSAALLAVGLVVLGLAARRTRQP
jgi:hypothetical protein